MLSGNESKLILIPSPMRKRLLPWLPARWGCDLARLRELVASGAIGKVFMVRRREFSIGIRFDWQTRKKYGGGYLLNWGPHIVDQAVQLAGGKVQTVYGQLRQVINPGDVEDNFLAVLTMESGAILVCEYSIGVDRLPNWVVQGDHGTIFVKETSLEIHRFKYPADMNAASYGNKPEVTTAREELSGGRRITMSNRYGDPYAIYPAIARAIRGQTPFPVTAESALNLTRILDAVRTSSKTGRVVRLCPA